ncbi:MAG: hypothetical protein QW578_08405, partial [Thermoplasmatales archaeon]
PQGIYQIFIGINMQQYQYTAPPVTSYNTTLVVNIYQNTVIYYNFTYIMFNYTINVYSAPTFIQPYQYSVYLNGTCVNGTTLNYSFSGTVTSQNYQIQMNLLPGYFSGMFVQYSQFYTPTQVPFTISYQANNIQIALQTNYTPVTLQISGFVTGYLLYIYVQNQTNPVVSLNSNSSTQIINVAPFTTYTYSGTDLNSPPDYANGSFYITGPNQTVSIVFLPQLQTTIFLIETGLPANIQWSATITVTYTVISASPGNINGVVNTIVQTNSSTTNIIGFSVPYNSQFTIYIQNVTYINTYVPSPNTIQGMVSSTGSSSSPYNIAFSIYTSPSQPPTTTGGSSYLPGINQALGYVLPFSTSVFWIIVYVLFIIGLMGYVAYKTGNTMATIITGGALVSIGYVMNVIPGWIIAFLFAIAIATILYVMFLRGDEGE